MLNFDLADTVAGQQIFEEGFEKGIREMIIEALTERFVAVPSAIREAVYAVGQHDALKALHRYAIRSSDMEEFGKILSKVSSVS